VILIHLLLALFIGYIFLTLVLTYLAHKLPRNPVTDRPDWGHIIDTHITAKDGGFLEVWRIEPEKESKGIIVLAHGWGRNRDRMVSRAKIFGLMGFTTIIHSARDHGGSSPCRLMSIDKFGEDIETVINWIGEPVILYGHSAGSGGAIIAAARNPELVKLLFLEGSFAQTKEALLSLYRWFNRFFGSFFGPAIVFWMNLFYSGGINRVSPSHLVPKIRIPVMMIHGEKDRRFPLEFALKLKQSFSHDKVELYVGKGAGHSDASKTGGYIKALRSFLQKQGILEI
jgi:pimeloyl-ACP methyl ester carboxylesterase